MTLRPKASEASPDRNERSIVKKHSRQEAAMVQTILVPVDGSKRAESILGYVDLYHSSEAGANGRGANDAE